MLPHSCSLFGAISDSEEQKFHLKSRIYFFAPRHKMSTHVYAWTLNYRWTSYISREGNLTPWKRGQGWCCYQLVTKVPTLHNPVRSVGVCMYVTTEWLVHVSHSKPYFSSLWLWRCLTFMYTVFPKGIDRLLANLVFN